MSLRIGIVTLLRTSALLWSWITVFVVTGWSFWHCGSAKSCWYTDSLIIDTSAAMSSWTLRYFSFDECVASCMSANTCLFGLDVFTVHMYIASKLSSSESLACKLCGDFVNASTTFTSSIVFTFVLCGFVRHLLVKCPYFWHFLHWNLDAGQLNPGLFLCLHSVYICLDQRVLEILACVVFVLVRVAALVGGLA